MMRTLLIAVSLTLSACTSSVSGVDVPQDMRSCSAGAAPSAPPPVPRTTETIAKAYNKEKAKAEITYSALKDCRSKLERINAWLHGNQY